MKNRPNQLYDTRHHYPDGILWRGYLYASVPQLAHKKRVMIVEDHENHLLVSNYSCNGWHDKCAPVGEQYESKRIGVGRPTKNRISQLQSAVRELQA